MGRLTMDGGREVWLHVEHTIGRHRDSELVLAADDVSRHHAVIRWHGERWVLKDLGSRNGSFIEGGRLPSGGERGLRLGDRVSIGSSEHMVVACLAPPEPMARAEDGALQVGHGSVLGLPDAAEPSVQIVRRGEGWALDGPRGIREVVDGESVQVDGASWQLHLPAILQGTWTASALESPVLTFEVSQDEEHVRVVFTRAGETVQLGSRVHHYTLLQLARQRVRDAADGVSPPEQGWLAQVDLERMLRLDRNVVYQHLYRARRELAGPLSGTDTELIERRHDAGQLRIGLEHVEVRRTVG